MGYQCFNHYGDQGHQMKLVLLPVKTVTKDTKIPDFIIRYFLHIQIYNLENLHVGN
jgi:hypothetical protein